MGYTQSVQYALLTYSIDPDIEASTAVKLSQQDKYFGTFFASACGKSHLKSTITGIVNGVLYNSVWAAGYTKQNGYIGTKPPKSGAVRVQRYNDRTKLRRDPGRLDSGLACPTPPKISSAE